MRNWYRKKRLRLLGWLARHGLYHYRRSHTIVLLGGGAPDEYRERPEP